MIVSKQPGFVLHTRPYRESSLLVELFTREHGRFTVVAKGARRLKSPHRGMLRPFMGLLVSWTGKGDLPILSQSEAVTAGIELHYDRLWCGFYLNELLIRLLHRHDPHADLFDYYAESLDSLSTQDEYEGVLRIFEKRLLKEIGYALDLSREWNTGTTVDTSKHYRYIPTQGLMVCEPDDDQAGPAVSGATLLALDSEELQDPLHLKESKGLMRNVIAYYLSGKQLQSRKGYAGTKK